MARTPGRDNRMEKEVRSTLHTRGLRFWVHRRLIPGSQRTVDIVFPKCRLAVFIDGCFWHGCPTHRTYPKSNAKWWRNKIEENIRRDADSNKRLQELGWTVIRIWEHEGTKEAADRIGRHVDQVVITDRVGD